jgi:hypothetical protein
MAEKFAVYSGLFTVRDILECTIGTKLSFNFGFFLAEGDYFSLIMQLFVNFVPLALC